MPETKHCQRCGALLGAYAPEGLCPNCMLQAGLQLPGPEEPLVEEPAAPEQGMPRWVGGYELLEEIGHGGMGVVYLAEQKQPVRRRVALKLIKLGMDTRQVIARFEAERQALALMDHPNIARIFEGGATDTGRPYFVMELVRGSRITDYCDQHNLSTSERLNLFMQVCRAIQHAHQKGIIHRDIKPSNVLVTIQDGQPVPKVIDFGVAKATGQSLTDKTVFTAFEQMVGTPAYMSPEQAELGSADIDTRSDIYSLGVLLYELLTGRTPFDSAELLRAGLEAMRRKIREEEPPRPSTRLTSLANEELTRVAKQRRAEPPKLISLVRGDLDWIVMKALEKERSRRYESINGLADDIHHYLHNETVLARPAGNFYRFQKLVRRNKVVFGAAAAVTAALVCTAVVSLWQTTRAVRSRSQATASARKAQLVTSFLTNMFQSIDPAVAQLREVTVRDVLDQAARDIGTAFPNDSSSELLLRQTFADIYTKLGHDDLALPHAEACLRLARAAAGAHDSPDTAESLNRVAGCLEGLGRTAEALSTHQEALAMYQRLHPGDHPDIVDSLNYVALCLDALGRPAEALPKLESALAMAQRLHPGDDPEVAECLNNLASILNSLGRPAEALPKYQAALEMRRRLYPGAHPDVVTSLNNLATCLDDSGHSFAALTNYEQALAMSQRLYRGDHPYLATSLNNLAACLLDQGRAAEALPKYEAALAMRQRLFPGDHPYVSTSLNNLALCLEALDRRTEALPKLEAALAMRQRLFPGDHPYVSISLNNLAMCLEALDRRTEALTNYESALLMRQRLFPGDHPLVAKSLVSYASCLSDSGRPAEGLPRFEEALAMLRRLYKGDQADIAKALFYLANCQATLALPEEALVRYQDSAAMYQRLLQAEPNHHALQVNLARTCEKKGELLAKLNRAEEAKQEYRKAVELAEAVLAADASDADAKRTRDSCRAKLEMGDRR
jgi:serine/threonine protein kinase/tetratricopeptide (TPR) repeat protein